MKTGINGLHKLRCPAVFLICAAVLLLSGAYRASAAEQKRLPYLIKVNRYYNTVTVYEIDKKGEYNLPVKAMACSVGTGSKTTLGTFKTGEKYRWKELMGDVYGQYATRIVGGILFHSVYYYENGNPASLATAEFNKLGLAASHGCIRLTVEDAKWIYDNCGTGTTVIIYEDKKSPGPLGKPEAVKIAKSVRWDPTDPDRENPYMDRLPQIEGVKDVEIAWGGTVDLRKGVTVRSSVGVDITSRLEVEGEVDPYIPGEYKIYYSAEDELGRLKMKAAVITIQECPETPVISGVSDRTAKEEEKIDRAFALSGVEAYCLGRKLDQKLIDVTIDRTGEDEYYITYKIKLGKRLATEHAVITVDREAESLTEAADRAAESDEETNPGGAAGRAAETDEETNPGEVPAETEK